MLTKGEKDETEKYVATNGNGETFKPKELQRPNQDSDEFELLTFSWHSTTRSNSNQNQLVGIIVKKEG